MVSIQRDSPFFSACLERQSSTGQEWKWNKRAETTVNRDIEAEGAEQTVCALGALPRRMTNGSASPWPALSKTHYRIGVGKQSKVNFNFGMKKERVFSCQSGVLRSYWVCRHVQSFSCLLPHWSLGRNTLHCQEPLENPLNMSKTVKPISSASLCSVRSKKKHICF